MDIKQTLTKGVKEATKEVAPDKTIKELIAKVFATRNALHFAHWATKSYAEHEALGYIYTAVVNKLDEIVEVYQGRHGLLQNVSCGGSTAPKNILNHIKEEAQWLGANREKICHTEAVGALVDELEASYLKTIYKLENLK